jgi:putative ABC transport system permease protein
MTGMLNSLFLDTAVVSTGHVKIMTRAYEEENQLLPNDLALLETDQLVEKLSLEYPDYFWTPRITFGGLLDVPDENGETMEQGPTIALAVDFFSSGSRQVDIWELKRRLTAGRIPEKPQEVLLSTKLAERLGLEPGEVVTFIGSTMHNAFTTYNFMVSGTFNLNMGAIDKQMMLLDISGARIALDMDYASSEILGYSHDLYYNDDDAVSLRLAFNASHSDSSDIFSPFMLALRDGSQLGTMVDFSDAAMGIIVSIFLAIVMVVLWNMGLMSGLRRYGEIGMRLAMGESKGQVYRSMIMEAVIIGVVGTVIGTALGLPLTYYVQEVGIDYSEAMETIGSTSFIFSNIFYTKVTPDLYYIGFFPGVLATVLGTMLAGRAVYKREMAQLFKELET